MAMDEDLAEDLGNSFELVGADNVDVRDREAAWKIIAEDAASLAMVDRILRPSGAPVKVAKEPEPAPMPAPAKKAEEPAGSDEEFLRSAYPRSYADRSMR